MQTERKRDGARGTWNADEYAPRMLKIYNQTNADHDSDEESKDASSDEDDAWGFSADELKELAAQGVHLRDALHNTDLNKKIL